MARLMMQGLPRLLPLKQLRQVPSPRKQTQLPSHQDKVASRRSLLRRNARLAHRHDQISYGALQTKIDHLPGLHPIFLLAPKYPFLMFTLNAIFQLVALAVETQISQGQIIPPTILAGPVIMLATTAEAWTQEMSKDRPIDFPLIAMATGTALIHFAAEQSSSLAIGTETGHPWTAVAQT